MSLFVVALAAVYSGPRDRLQELAGAVDSARETSGNRTTLLLDVIDDSTGKRTAARFSLTVDGKPFYPERIGQHGLRFVSVHESKKQTYVVTYARGTGSVEVTLPTGARKVDVDVAKGFEYLPSRTSVIVSGNRLPVTARLRRWTNQIEQGWTAADEHVHYDRLEKSGDKDWLTMLAGDGLMQAHFMVLKGGKVPGIWAKQYAYGKKGEAFDGQRLIRSGEEYRDSAQGHINLLGLDEVIQPISTGGLGSPPVRENYPPLFDVFQQARKLGGLVGVAHGGSLGRHPTAIVDTVLGGVDFFEIANAHLYAVGLWYRLMNCGYHLPPAAGTDLPNFPFRDRWQPFLGSMRMYVKMDSRRDFQSWKQAVKQGKVFVTSGPILSLSVDGTELGGTVRLPASGGEINIETELASPIGLRTFEIVQNGAPVNAEVEKTRLGGVDRWRIRKRLRISQSCWIAARGKGLPIEAMKASVRGNPAWLESDVIAHTAAIRVQVGDKPIRSAADANFLIRQLRQQREYYRTKGQYKDAQHRLRVVELFEKAITELQKRGRSK